MSVIIRFTGWNSYATSASYPVGNFGVHQLLDGSFSIYSIPICNSGSLTKSSSPYFVLTSHSLPSFGPQCVHSWCAFSLHSCKTNLYFYCTFKQKTLETVTETCHPNVRNKINFLLIYWFLSQKTRSKLIKIDVPQKSRRRFFKVNTMKTKRTDITVDVSIDYRHFRL